MQLEAPPWAAYAVLAFGGHQVAWCSGIEIAVRAIREHDLALRCEVVRVKGDVCVWPMIARGGTA